MSVVGTVSKSKPTIRLSPSDVLTEPERALDARSLDGLAMSDVRSRYHWILVDKA